MSGNFFGKHLCISTFGESHGWGYGVMLDGCPAGIALSERDIQLELDRRRPGQSTYTSQRREHDQVEIVSGIYGGLTTGAPIGMLIKNHDARSSDYTAVENTFRPGHADFTYHHKYGHRDHRGGGRASARETMMRVAAGAIAKKYCSNYFGIHIQGYCAQIGEKKLHPLALDQVYHNPFFSPDPYRVDELATYIDDIRKHRDSIGTQVCVIASGVPIGLGEPVYDGLDARLAHAMMSINAAKAVEIGDGVDVITQKGSEHRDAILPDGFASNHSGGVLGGISTGQDLVVKVAFKPASSIPQAIDSITTSGEKTQVLVTGRHDPCVGIRAVPVVEAMMALVLMDAVLVSNLGKYRV